MTDAILLVSVGIDGMVLLERKKETFKWILDRGEYIAREWGAHPERACGLYVGLSKGVAPEPLDSIDRALVSDEIHRPGLSRQFYKRKVKTIHRV